MTERKPAKPKPASAAPHRLSLSQIVELLLTRGTDHSTVTLTRNAKGETQIDVQVRTGSQDDAPTVEDAARKARYIYDGLREAYPLPERGEDADVTLTRNAKGDTQITVELSTSDNGGPRTLADIRDQAGDVYETLRGRFPTAAGTVGN